MTASNAKHSPATTVYKRLESTTQTEAIADLQIRSNEVCGKAPTWNGFVCVKAYRGPLKPGERGIEFTTTVAESPRMAGHPNLAVWDLGTAGTKAKNGNSMVCIDVFSIRKVY